MKFISHLVLLSLSCTLLHAGIKIPKYVHSFKDLDKAKAEAVEKSKPLAFLHTDPAST